MRACSRHADRLRRSLVAAAAGLIVTAATSRGRAEVSFALSWRSEGRANACVTEDMLRAAVEDKLGRKPFVDREHARILIDGEEIALGRDRFRARVTERDRRGEVLGVRELASQSCPSLQRAATLIVALTIDPYLAGKRMAGDPSEEEAPPERPPPSADLPPSPPPRDFALRVAPRAPAATAPRWQLWLGLGAGTSVGVLPSASATVLVVARLESTASRFSFEWRGGYSVPQRLRDGPVEGDFSAIEQHVRSCFALGRWTSQKLDACVGASAAAVIPSTSGIRSGSRSDRWRALIGPSVAVAYEHRLGDVRGRVELGLMLPLRKYAFSYLDVANERKGFYSTDAVVFFVALTGLGKIS